MIYIILHSKSNRTRNSTSLLFFSLQMRYTLYVSTVYNNVGNYEPSFFFIFIVVSCVFYEAVTGNETDDVVKDGYL